MISACYHGQRVELTLPGRVAFRFPLRHRAATVVRLPGPDDRRPQMCGVALAVWDGEHKAREVHTTLLSEAKR